jgi:hypothetical protein
VPLGSWLSDLIGYAFQNVPDRSNDLGGTTMGRRSNKAFPEPRIHPAKGLLRLRVNGREFWLGKPGTRLADERRAAILAAWGGLCRLSVVQPSKLNRPFTPNRSTTH